MKLVILDGYTLNPGDLSWEGIRALADEVVIHDRTAPDQVLERARGAEILLTNKVVLSDETIQALCPTLRYIGVLATGYNVVDISAAHRLGITVTNIPAYSTASVAQMVFALLLTITNRPEHYAQQICHEGRWTASPDFCYWDTHLMELAGKQMGIVGLGRTGSAVANIALAMGMRVVAYTSRPQEQLPHGIQRGTMDQVLGTSDVISLHCPLTEDTHHLICRERLALMQPGTILINTSRGPVVDEQAVAEALQEGRLGAFAADVLSVEPARQDNPLLSAPHVFLTPHIAWATIEARTRLMHICEGNIRAYLHGTPQNTI